MPILMTSVIGWPSAPCTRPSRTSAAKLSIFSRVPITSGMTSWPSTSTRLPEKLRKAVCRTASLRDIDLHAGEHRVAPGLDLASLGEFDEFGQNGGVDTLLGEIKQEIVEGDAELLELRRIVGEIRSRRPRQHALLHAGQFRQCRRVAGSPWAFSFPPLAVKRDAAASGRVPYAAPPTPRDTGLLLRLAARRFWTARSCRSPPATA